MGCKYYRTLHTDTLACYQWFASFEKSQKGKSVRDLALVNLTGVAILVYYNFLYFFKKKSFILLYIIYIYIKGFENICKCKE